MVIYFGHLKKTGCKYYSKEAFLLLLNYHFLFSEWLTISQLTSLIMGQKNKFIPRGIVAIAAVLGGQIKLLFISWRVLL